MNPSCKAPGADTLGQGIEVGCISPAGVPHCGFPAAGDLSGFSEGHCRAQRRPGLPGPSPAAGEWGGDWGASGAGLGLPGCWPSGHMKEWAVPFAGGPLLEKGGKAPARGRVEERTPSLGRGEGEY